jgi:hypothetical protein
MYTIQIPFGVMYKCVVKDDIGAYCHSEGGEVLTVNKDYVRVQGIGKQQFSILKQGQVKTVEIDFGDVGITEISTNQ